jgi:hypothetical protein
MCLFCVCAVLCLGRGLATSWSLVQGVLPIVNGSGDWKAARAHKGCRDIQKNVGAGESSRVRGSVTWFICLVKHHITGHLMFVLVSTEWVMMCPTIDKPASCGNPSWIMRGSCPKYNEWRNYKVPSTLLVLVLVGRLVWLLLVLVNIRPHYFSCSPGVGAWGSVYLLVVCIGCSRILIYWL